MTTISIDGKDYKIQDTVADIIEAQRVDLAQLEAENVRCDETILKLSKEKHGLKADVTILENEVIRLEDKNEALMKLAGMYIKSYEDLAFGDADMERAYCDFCDDVIKPEEMDERHSIGIGDYHAECCPDCTGEATDDPHDERNNLQEIHDEYEDDFLAKYLLEAIQKIDSLTQRLQEKDLTIANLEGELECLHSYLDRRDCPQGNGG